MSSLLSSYLLKNNIFFTEASDKNEIINKLIDRAVEHVGMPFLREVLQKEIFERESLMSTGIGKGIAVPHARLKEIDKTLIYVAKLTSPINFNSIDHLPVRIIFLIITPLDTQRQEYLNILSTIVVRFKDPKIRRRLLGATTPQKIYEILID